MSIDLANDLTNRQINEWLAEVTGWAKNFEAANGSHPSTHNWESAPKFCASPVFAAQAEKLALEYDEVKYIQALSNQRLGPNHFITGNTMLSVHAVNLLMTASPREKSLAALITLSKGNLRVLEVKA